MIRLEEVLNRAAARDERYERAKAIELPKAYLGVNVFKLRKAKGLTQKELARRAGLRQPRIAEIERGDANPNLETLGKLSYALACPVDHLLRDIGASNWFRIPSSEVVFYENPEEPTPAAPGAQHSGIDAARAELLREGAQRVLIVHSRSFSAQEPDRRAGDTDTPNWQRSEDVSELAV